MNGFKASILFFGGVIVFNIMFDAASSIGGGQGIVIGAFTMAVLLYVTGFFDSFKK